MSNKKNKKEMSKKSDKEIKEEELLVKRMELSETTTDPENIGLLLTQEDSYLKANILRVEKQKKPKATLTDHLLKNKYLTEDQIGSLFDMLYANWKDASKRLNPYRHIILKQIANVYVNLLQKNDEVVKTSTKEEKDNHEYAVRERNALLGYIVDVTPDILQVDIVKKAIKKKRGGCF